jgi:excisionase family DNA binding protein
VIDLEHELSAALRSPRVLAALEELLRRVVREELASAGLGDALLAVPQAADLLGMTPAAVNKAAQRGTLPCVRIGRRVRFRRNELLTRLGSRTGGRR